MTGPDQTLRGGALNAAISNAVVGLFSDHVGKGPPKARAIHSDKIVVCILEDTMTKGERRLAADGKEDLVLEMRRGFQDMMRKALTDSVEALTERKVVAFMSPNHVDPDLAAEVFVLDEPIVREVEVVGYPEEAPHAQATNDAERWVEIPFEVAESPGATSVDDGSFSSQATARSRSPSN